MKHLDLFSGIGGFSLALEKVLGEIEGGFSEIDKYAIQVYKKHFPGHTDYGDITAIRERELPYFDLITFGFPCQDLSIAGKRKGFDGHRSSLFHEAIRIINAVRPKYFIFENVKGLFSSRKGEDFITVLQTITDIGYSGQWQLLNTKWFLPQNRERIYFIGHITGEPRPEVFPIGESPKILESEEGVPCTCLQSTQWKGGATLIGLNPGQSQGYRVYSTDGISQTLAGEAGGLGAKTGLYATYRHAFEGFKGYENLSPSIKSSEGSGNQILLNCIRRLTPTECERLQGFPDGWTEGISDTQRYKTLGNSITVNVAEEIFRKLYT